MNDGPETSAVNWPLSTDGENEVFPERTLQIAVKQKTKVNRKACLRSNSSEVPSYTKLESFGSDGFFSHHLLVHHMCTI